MISQAFFMGREKYIFSKRDNSFCKAIRQYLGFFRTQQAGELVASAGAIAGQHRHFVPLFIFAALGDVSLIMLVFLFHKATACMVGPPLRRTAADVAVAGTFPGDGMGHSRRFKRQRRKGTHKDQ
jgi:hypothetical protein